MIQRETADASPSRSQAAAEPAKAKRGYTRRYRCREGCGNIVEDKDSLCEGCDAYREHTGAF